MLTARVLYLDIVMQKGDPRLPNSVNTRMTPALGSNGHQSTTNIVSLRGELLFSKGLCADNCYYLKGSCH